MIIDTLKINGFRNISSEKYSFLKSTNLIHGNNGSGKTSILEAIFLMGFGKSFLNRKKSEMINHNCDEFHVQMEVSSMIGKNTIAAHYKNRFSLLLDEKKTNIFEINQHIFPVFFSSSDYNLYIESKPYTRKIMDRFIFGTDPLYIRYLLSYNKALKQKNHLLKTTHNVSELRSWNKIISELAEKLVGTKMKFIEQLNLEVKEKFDNRLEIRYEPSFDIEYGIAEPLFFNQLEAVSKRELKAARAVVGPHRDGFQLVLEDKPLAIYSSGEKKIHLLMIFIAFIELFKKIKNRYPVFLVDDFDTTMDTGNINFLIDHYPDMQVIATSVNHYEGFQNLIELKKEN